MNGESITVAVLGLDGKNRALGLKFEDHEEFQHIFLLTELFRSALRILVDDEYRLDITKRDVGVDGFGALKKQELEEANKVWKAQYSSKGPTK